MAATNNIDLFQAFFEGDSSYLAGFGSFISDYLVIFILSSIFAKYIETGVAAESIANSIVKLIGSDDAYKVLMAIFVIGSLLTIGGISVFVVLFVVIPLARPLFKKLNIPWYLLARPYFLGVGTYTISTFPGSPQIQNIIPAQTFATPLTAAPIPSVLASVALIIWTSFRIKYELDKAKKNGLTYESGYQKDIEEPSSQLEQIPNLGPSIFPLLSMILMIVIGSYMDVDYILYIALIFANLVSAILFKNYIPSQKELINPGVSNSFSAMLLPAAAVGFGTVLGDSQGLIFTLNQFTRILISSIIIVGIVTFILGVAVGSASAGLGISTRSVVPLYDLSNIHPEVAHRLVSISGINYAPHNNALLTFNSISGLEMDDYYKDFSVSVHGGILLQFIVVYISSLIIY